ncbi:alpha/beta hydrolase [Microbacterium sp. KR10-403]|uniref:alpha/beta fold hydrolase n=1 Tax=Microbacterium sp. KR10-403 TaxID=3158581 RepID=UPI0032E42F7C
MSAISRGAETAFELRGDRWSINIVADKVGMSAGGSPRFQLQADDTTWSALLTQTPLAGWQSIVHLVRTGTVELHGSEVEYARHIHLVRALLDAARGADDWHPDAPARLLQARGEYQRVSSALGTADVYVERCGTGPALLALATAGSDTSQWHGLMTQSDITERHELVTVDLPWHGKSSPTFGTPLGGWRLKPATYTDFICRIADELDMRRPVLVGASMAGAAVVHALARHPARFGGAVACQVGPRVRNRAAPQLRSADIDQSLFVPEWTYGLMNPASPAEYRKRVWWGYSSGGAGLYSADIASYEQWEFDEVRPLLSESTPHIAVLSGAFDTTVPPSASRELAAVIPNSSFEEMPDLGHFPHAENPAVFATYLEKALTRITQHDPLGPHLTTR